MAHSAALVADHLTVSIVDDLFPGVKREWILLKAALGHFLTSPVTWAYLFKPLRALKFMIQKKLRLWIRRRKKKKIDSALAPRPDAAGVGCPRPSEKPRAVLFVPQSDLDLGVLVHRGLALRRQTILGKVMNLVSSPFRKEVGFGELGGTIRRPTKWAFFALGRRKVQKRGQKGPTFFLECKKTASL